MLSLQKNLCGLTLGSEHTNCLIRETDYMLNVFCYRQSNEKLLI